MMEEEWKKLQNDNRLNMYNDLTIIDINRDVIQHINEPKCMKDTQHVGVPHIFFMDKNNKKIDYTGERTLDHIAKFIKDNIERKSQILNYNESFR